MKHNNNPTDEEIIAKVEKLNTYYDLVLSNFDTCGCKNKNYI